MPTEAIVQRHGQSLSIARPSATVGRFRTRPRPRSALASACRVLLVGTVLFLLHRWLEKRAWSGYVGARISAAVIAVGALVSICAQSEGACFQNSKADDADGLLVMRGLGVQLEHRRIVSIGAQAITVPFTSGSAFIPLASIDDIVLIERLSGWAIVWSLVIISRAADDRTRVLTVVGKVCQICAWPAD